MNKKNAIGYLQRRGRIREDEVKEPKFNKEEKAEIKMDKSLTRSDYIFAGIVFAGGMLIFSIYQKDNYKMLLGFLMMIFSFYLALSNKIEDLKEELKHGRK